MSKEVKESTPISLEDVFKRMFTKEELEEMERKYNELLEKSKVDNEKREELLAEIIKNDEELGLYDEPLIKEAKDEFK
jgi:hypothetical protein